MLSNRTLAGVLTVALLLTAVSLPGQTLEFRGNPGRPVTGNYSVSAPVEITRTVTIRHRQAATDYTLTVSPGSSIRSAQHQQGSASLEYQILDAATGQPLSDSYRINGSFPASGNQWQVREYDLVFRLLPGQLPMAGRYEDSPVLELYIGTQDTGQLADDSIINLRIDMDEVIDMQITPAGSGYGSGSTFYELNFENLLPHTAQQVDLGVLANTPYNVLVQSQNAANLRESISGDTVAYRFRFDGSPVDLASGTPVTAAASLAPTGSNGRTHTLQLEILPYTELPAAGTYQDEINITIEAP
ncbi:hypothetical protein [Spirochaeta africana]|uniref:Spore coat protein U domain-containing protein n=1 Tax=Spirochaeta africana (strain ATCC 700263 / DSM 8902 / Z-7692) TaxID=889378 RepID=H9UFX3_SPIAZ|nr:hypothetical protein [Spirochaeta africana]AFG36416.1 hypothetical protein Spiaf_0308 [Spirochaeta africana DSM 8902]